MSNDFEEGGDCPEVGCGGKLVVNPVENCSCHLSAPCGQCVDNPLTCCECWWQPEREPYTESKQAADNLVWMPSKPRVLDNTKIDYRKESHSNSSMKVVGVYPDGVTQSQVEALVKGTFGGRFDQFQGGRFTYIAYTD